jgi:hypothetical protein
MLRRCYARLIGVEGLPPASGNVPSAMSTEGNLGVGSDSSTTPSLRTRYSLRVPSAPNHAGFSCAGRARCCRDWNHCNAERKTPWSSPRFGTFYYWCLSFVFLTATILAATRWHEDAYLFFLGAGSFSAATLGRTARRRRWHRWVPIHISGMGLSYILMLIAFYMDNGKELPVWKDLPSVTYWLVPGGVGVPLIVRALLRYRTRFGAGNRD